MICCLTSGLYKLDVAVLQVWDFVIIGDDHRLVTGAGDSELRVWDIAFQDEVRKW